MLPVQPSPVYEARFCFTPKGTLFVLLSAAGVIAAVAATGTPAPLRALTFILAACATLAMTATMTSPLAALRVDAEGITLGGNPLWRYQTTTVTVPWHEITGIVLYTHRLRPRSTPSYIQVLHERAPATDPGAIVPSPPKAVRREWATGRRVSGWRLDRARFATVLAWHAPHIPLADST